MLHMATAGDCIPACQTQHLVRHRQQGLAAEADMLGIFFIFRMAKRTVQFLRHDFGEAENGIERGAHVMADAIEAVLAGFGFAGTGAAGQGEVAVNLGADGRMAKEVELVGVGKDLCVEMMAVIGRHVAPARSIRRQPPLNRHSTIRLQAY